MNRLLTKLQAYGVDIDVTMERFINDEDLYAECFGMFLEDNNVELLKTALISHNYDDAFKAAHTIKGVVGNLGLKPFSDKICFLVEKLRAQDYSDLGTQLNIISDELKLLQEIGQDDKLP